MKVYELIYLLGLLPAGAKVLAENMQQHLFEIESLEAGKNNAGEDIVTLNIDDIC